MIAEVQKEFWFGTWGIKQRNLRRGRGGHRVSLDVPSNFFFQVGILS